MVTSTCVVRTWSIVNMFVSLALVKYFHIFFYIFNYGRPIAPNYEEFPDQARASKCCQSIPSCTSVRVYATSSFFKHFNIGVGSPLWYNVPSIKVYELSLLFMRVALVELERSIPCSMYVGIRNIQDSRAMSLISIITTLWFYTLRLLRVSTMEEFVYSI